MDQNKRSNFIGVTKDNVFCAHAVRIRNGKGDGAPPFLTLALDGAKWSTSGLGQSSSGEQTWYF